MSFHNKQSIVVSPSGSLTTEGVECLFGFFGEIKNIYFDFNSKGDRICWICYSSHAYANKAIESLDGAVIGSTKININPAQFYIRKQKFKSFDSEESSDDQSSSDSYSAEEQPKRHRHRHHRKH